MSKKQPRGTPFAPGHPKVGGRKPGTAGRRLHLTIPKDVAARLPENDNKARAVIFEALREFFNDQKSE